MLGLLASTEGVDEFELEDDSGTPRDWEELGVTSRVGLNGSSPVKCRLKHS